MVLKRVGTDRAVKSGKMGDITDLKNVKGYTDPDTTGSKVNVAQGKLSDVATIRNNECDPGTLSKIRGSQGDDVKKSVVGDCGKLPDDRLKKLRRG